MLDVFANLVELVAGIRKLLLLGGVQVFPHLVEIPQEIALFLAQAFQLAQNLFLLFFGFGHVQRDLQILDLVIDSFLTTGQVFKTLKILLGFAVLLLLFALLFEALLLCFAFGLVAAFFLAQLHVIDLLLIRIIGLLPALPGLATSDIHLTGAHLEQRLIGGLFFLDGIIQGIDTAIASCFL